MGVSFFGAYASHVFVEPAYLFARPAGFSAAEAAAFPSVWMTAWFALCELAHPRPGQRLLLHSAAGGVGCAVSQLAKILDCEVTGVVGRREKVDIARRFGCDHVICKAEHDLWTEAERISPDGFNVILDGNGVATLRQSWRHLAAPGKLVTFGFSSMLPVGASRPNWLKLAWDLLRTPRFSPLEMTNRNRSALSFNLSYLFDQRALLAEAMTQLLAWVEEGRIRPHPTHTFPLADAPAAHRALQSGTTTGKLLLVP